MYNVHLTHSLLCFEFVEFTLNRVFKCFICLILGVLYTFPLVEKTIFVGRKVDKTAIGNMIKN